MRSVLALLLAATLLPAAAAPRRALILVTNTANAGAGSLRQAILDSNLSVGVTDTIEFDIAGPPPHVISLASALPDLQDTVIIDGTTESDYVDIPVIAIDVNAVVSAPAGLRVAAPNCIIRGLSISHCGPCVLLSTLATGSAVETCWLGLDGVGAPDNDHTYGVEVQAANCTIGGPSPTQMNVISAAIFVGVIISGNNTVIQNNFIGTNPEGTAAWGLQPYGISVQSGSTGTVIGGATGEANVVSGHSSVGIKDAGSGTTIRGNIVGLNTAGNAAIPNATGIELTGSGAVVGGTVLSSGNLISGNSGAGIYSTGTNVTIQGNYIGVDGTVTTSIPNGSGISFGPGGSSVLVGGTTAAARNLISGNLSGISVSGNGVTIQGNRIGTNSAGTASLPNLGEGIQVGGSNCTIGGSVAGAGNLISGNGSSGIEVSSTASNLSVEGNKIGTNAAGTASIPNIGAGIDVGGGVGVTIGSAAGGLAGNLISGNQSAGIHLRAASTGVQIHANRIGTDAAGSAALPNGAQGIWAQGADHVIGDLVVDSRNLISGNATDGIRIDGTNIDVTEAYIGVDAAGTGALPNLALGIRANGSDLKIRQCLIANNGGGLTIEGQDVGLFTNAIYDNGSPSIELSPAGPGANDPLDTDPGPNGAQNYPVLYVAEDDGASTVVKGALHSAPNTTYYIEIHHLAGHAADAFGHGPCAAFDDAGYFTTDVNGDLEFTFTLPYPLGLGEFVTAFASRDGVCVSECARNVEVTAPAGPVLLKVLAPDPGPFIGVSASPILLGGIALAELGLSEITWSNATTGGVGTAAATTEWTASIPLGAGINDVTIQMRDLAGDSASAILQIEFIPLTGDVTAPVVTVTTPATATYETGGNVLFVSGTASDEVGVGTVVWSVAPGGISGTATGMVSWSAVVPLADGANTVTVRAYDTSGNLATDTVAVTVTVGGGTTTGPTYNITEKKNCGLLGIEPLLILALLALRRRLS